MIIAFFKKKHGHKAKTIFNKNPKLSNKWKPATHLSMLILSTLIDSRSFRKGGLVTPHHLTTKSFNPLMPRGYKKGYTYFNKPVAGSCKFV